MTTATATPHRTGRLVRRLQAGLLVGGLLASVGVTAVLVATPASSRPAAGAAAPVAAGLPADTRLEVRGGDPFVAYEIADRLAASGGQVLGVAPTAAGSAVAPETLVVYYDRRSVAEARLVRDMLGQGTLRRQQVFAPGVDVTIVLGKDLQQR